MFKAVNQAGLIIVELLLAILLGLLIVSFLWEIFTAVKHGQHLQIALHNIQTHAKQAIDILAADIHQAGYLGCARLTREFPLVSFAPYQLLATTKLQGYDGISDAVTIRHASYPAAILMRDMQQKKADFHSFANYSILYASNIVRFAEGSILLIADCQSAEIFVAKHVIHLSNGLQKIISNKPLHTNYLKNSEISYLVENHYFIGKTKYQYADGSVISALYVKKINHRKIELVDGVEDMKIIYFVKQHHTYIRQHARDITDWSRVVGVSVELLLKALPFKKTWYLYAAPL